MTATLLTDGPITLLGRIMPASNQTFFCTLGEDPDGVKAVYKPISGERPLWDFPDGSLAAREYAAYLVSEQLGWNVVPPTLLRDGPAGPGMVQLWQEPVQDASPIDIVAVGAVPEGYLHVLDAHDERDRPVALVHEDTRPLRRMAVFDTLVNNTDRKGGHVLPMTDGHRYGVDHGVCFHVDDKLRTVLWGWSGVALSDEERAGVAGVRDAIAGSLGDQLGPLLDRDEIAALRQRCVRLLRTDCFPIPYDGWPVIPWPPF